MKTLIKCSQGTILTTKTLTLTDDEIREFYNRLIELQNDEQGTIEFINSFLSKLENRIKN